MEELGKVGKGGRLGQIKGYWDENGDKSQGDAVKSWILLVTVMKNDGIYPTFFRCTVWDNLSARYSELYGTIPAAREVPKGRAAPLGRNWWFDELQGESITPMAQLYK